MTKDKFKAYVDHHREDFDSYSQDYEQLWDNMAPKLARSRSQSKIRTYGLAVAAAGLVLIISTLFLRVPGAQKLPIELTEADTHYQPRIAAKMKVIQTHHQEIDAMVWEDLQVLDNVYEELKLDLKEQADSEEVMQAIIENYRIKLDVLDQILNEIEAKDDEKQQEQVDI